MKHFQPTEYPIIDAGVDWLTLTIKKEDSRSEECLALWYDVFYQHRKRYGLVSSANKLGYSGIACEGLYVGTRYDGAMLTLSGQAAKELWREVAHPAATATRIDLQVTIRAQGYAVEPSKRVAADAGEANQELPESRKRSIKTVQDNKEGMTTYVGSRQSDSFLRCYHKSAKDPDLYGENAWRYEVQYNRDLAPDVLDRLKGSSAEPETLANSFVTGWMYQRGLRTLWKLAGAIEKVKREVLPKTEIDKKLEWMYKQVRPTVLELIAQDYTNEVLIALLGLDLGRHVAGEVNREYEHMFAELEAKRLAHEWPMADENGKHIETAIDP